MWNPNEQSHSWQWWFRTCSRMCIPAECGERKPCLHPTNEVSATLQGKYETDRVPTRLGNFCISSIFLHMHSNVGTLAAWSMAGAFFSSKKVFPCSCVIFSNLRTDGDFMMSSISISIAWTCHQFGSIPLSWTKPCDCLPTIVSVCW